MFAGACLALLMPSIDQTIVATALPTITRGLHTSIAWSVWTVSVYQLGMVMATPIAGRLSDTLGRRRMFLFFVALFTTSSVLCGVAPNINLLIAFRFLEALGGGGFTPSITGLVADHFPRDRDRRVGLVMGIVPLGALIGPAIGGIVVTYLDWRAIFFVNLPVSLVVLSVLARVLPRSPRPAGRPVEIDLLGSGLLAGALVAFMLGMSQLGDRRGGWAPAALCLGAAAVLVPAFLARQERSRFPIFPAALIRRPVFALLNLLNFLYGAASIGVFALVPLYAQVRYGLSPLEAGLFLTVRAVAVALATAFTSVLLMGRLGYRVPIAIGYLGAIAGMALTALPSPLSDPRLWLSLTTALYGVGIGIAMPLNVAAFQLMPERIGVLTGIRMMFRQMGAITSLSVAGAAVARSSSEPLALAWTFAVLGLLTLLALPLVAGIPEPAPTA